MDYGYTSHSRNLKSMLALCWSTNYDDGPTLKVINCLLRLDELRLYLAYMPFQASAGIFILASLYLHKI